MFTDPIVLTKTGGSATNLYRTSEGDNTGLYRTPDGLLVATFRHSYGRRNRHTMNVIDTKTTPDPLVTGSSFIASLTAGIFVDVPTVGYTITEQQAVVGALTAFLTASSGANSIKMLGGES